MSASIEPDPDRDWDACVAHDLLGSIVIVGLTYLDPEGQLECKFQIYGLVAIVDKERGIAIECHGEIWNGQEHWLPPATSAFQKAGPGRFRLCSTDELIVDPDYVTTWTIRSRARN
jgi:hypothetical protein